MTPPVVPPPLSAVAPSVPVAVAKTPEPAASIDLNALMLDVVAAKTGYPAEMLTLDMNLESDLGIDSIKRVEILAAVQERAPGMPEVDAAEMSRRETLGEIQVRLLNK